ncbi:non-ribosomal peptide synthetase [Streptomyces sp. B3I8]|uniref:non-ribosomal peptide synthetase n=1 Tax=Streptomyces sp. B3I8 TaxID=3042303 RepID=UPI00277F3C58|nr:non-ribosomal peptide synthetase [Streptomyces sp. B3I8]MDQ0786680.1 amino acid adenylation domain-containing protein [Streptomyces sp. B3I8]
MNTADTISPGRHPELSILWGGRSGAAPAPGDTLLAWFEAWVERQPEAVAVLAGDEAWSYADIDTAAKRVAEALAGKVGRADLVGLCLDRSPGLIAAAVALARLGAVYWPLGPNPAAGRLAELVDANGVNCLLADTLVSPLPGWSVGVPAGLGRAETALTPIVRPEPAPRPTSAGPGSPEPFSAVTTSGTTGRPKVVLLAGPALAELVRWYCHMHELAPGDRVSLLLGTTFDVHQAEMWASLCSGATLCVAPAGARQSAAELLEWWQTASITSSFLPTPLSELVCAASWPADLALRHLTIGGDRMRTRPPAGVAVQVHNIYGPAEATVVTTAHHLRPGAPRDAVIPIGTPRDGAMVLIADPGGRPVPVGEAGEVLIGGSCLAIGYTDPDRTAERFFTAAPTAHTGPIRLYRTGDRACMDIDGELLFLGRMDDQVKISGVRVEPVEVETALERHAGVRNAVVIPVSGAGGAQFLAAFVRMADGVPRDAGTLLRTARRHLVEQAVPSHVHFVDAFPLNANGKVDRAALAASHTRAVADVQSAADGLGDTAGRLLDICRRLLDVPVLELSDSFADRGGTSLAFARLLAAVQGEFGVTLRAARAMRQPDLGALAVLIDSVRDVDAHHGQRAHSCEAVSVP